MENSKKITVVRDTREKARNGWYWTPDDTFNSNITDTVRIGDYTIKGLEEVIAIERKYGAEELAKNVFEKRFPNCLARMNTVKHSFIIVECPFQDVIDYPYIKSIPLHIQAKIEITGKLLLKRLCEIQIQYGTNILYAGNQNNAWKLASSIFKRVNEKYA